ncbi:hypothetical protein EPR50_G00233920 [Perca flavescens]|uniref:NXPE C-terminal domain-containing protein n=1 Tax=Perca flavescens TaxID=8167 RepID=A0A484C0L7_PERFV|nr:hypothetical protein EPR50_G00233920 [Perca flavescens]
MKTIMKARACIRKEYSILFLCLAVVVVILVLRNMEVLETPSQFQHEVNSTIMAPRVSTDPDVHRGFCTFQPLSPEDAVEERLLLDSIAWPETPLLPTPLILEQTSDPAHSTFTVNMSDFQGRPKKSGGDLLLARLHNQKLGAGVAGQVVDHLNGSYSAVFSLLWEGDAQVEVMLAHPSEAITVLKRLKNEEPDRISHKNLFHSGSISETTICNVCLRPTQQLLCNLTSVQASLGQPEVESSTVKVAPSGYYYQGVWQALGGTTVRQFNASAISQCLKGKVVHMHGDSTVRQFFEFLNAALPARGKLDMALDYANNILVKYHFHGPPICIVPVSTSKLRYIANEIDGLIGGTNTVVVFGIWAHFGTFPMQTYIRRLLNIRRAVVRLLDRAPGTVVIILLNESM